MIKLKQQAVYDGVFLCCPFFLRDVLDEILDLIESVSVGFPIYSCFLDPQCGAAYSYYLKVIVGLYSYTFF